MGHPVLSVLASQERSLRWLAKKTGKSPSYVTRVLKGQRNPSPDFKAKTAEALGAPEAMLFPEAA